MTSFEIDDIGIATKVRLHGRLDTPGVDRIETRFIASVVPAGKHVLLDLTDVEFVSSMGIRMLIGTARALMLKQAKLILFGAKPLVAESLGQTIATIIPIVRDEAQALERLRA